MIKLLLSIIIILISQISMAQIETVELDEIVVHGLPFEKFTSGSKMEKSDSLTFSVLGQKTLSEYLQQNTTVYVKEQGNAMLASVSFRGTGSSHTGVYWHGINLNSLTLGSSDFNGIPLFLFDDLAIQYGGASSLHGSDAIGGSIHLNSIPTWTNGTNIQLRQDFGSFGNVFTGARIETGNGKWESKTAVFNKILKNNFHYTIQDRVGDEHKVEQENASVHNYALLQQFHRKIAQNAHFAIKGWYGNNYHQVQPLMVVTPDQPQVGDEIVDRNLRLIASYDHYFSKGTLQAATGYVWDYQLFNQTDQIETSRVFADVQQDWNFSEKTTIRVGGNANYIDPEVHSYTVDASEWRGDVFISANHELIRNWQWNMNLRKTFAPFTGSPLAPSLSTSYRIIAGGITLITRAQAERSYRIPTFNDRYWGDLGRLDLEAENGHSFEIGQNAAIKHENGTLEADVSVYFMNVDNWIAWKPTGSIWRPYNLKEVQASGIEFTGKYTREISGGSFGIGGMYAFNNSLLLEGISEDDPSAGYQLPYTPKHRAVLFTDFILKNYRLSLNNAFTGMRYGMDVFTNELEPFNRTDITAAKNINLGKNTISLEVQVLNVFDAAYQNVEGYAMPGRNYLFSINFFTDK
jgi:iron complex outermembrane receptor protein